MRMSTQQSSPPPSLAERILAYASLTIIGVALLSFFATLIIGMIDRHAVAEGFLNVVYGISLIGLPIGFALLIVLLVVSQRRRRAELRRNAKR